MVKTGYFTLVIFSLCSVSFVKSLFNVQYIGKFVTLENATSREFCGEIYCLSDMDILFSHASQNIDADPCIDFKEVRWI